MKEIQMNQVRKWNIIGGRVIKTGIAVFLQF